jgi:pre-60S factor REI1
MDTYTCMTCRMFFDSAEVQRAHYRAPWHCFNLKRKVAGLPPVTEEAFEDKVKALKNEKSALDSQAINAKQRPASKKTHKFISKGKGRNAVNNLAQAASDLGISLEDPATPVQAESDEELEPELTEEEMIEQRLKTAKPIPITECLFDGHTSSDLQSNLDYTRSKYSFFIPEIENLTDLEGMITYLGEKVGIGYTCLYCGKEYQSLPAVRSHMVDKSHCKIKFYEDDLEEYDDFYNFDDEDEEDAVENKQRALITVNDDGSVDTGITLSETGAELVLHSGKTIGNRAYKMYYKQRIRPTEGRTSVLIVQLVKQYGDLGVLKEKRADEIIARKKQEKRIRQNHYEHVKIQLKANRLQKYMHHKECMT